VDSGVEDVIADSKAHKVVVKGKKAAADPMKVVERVQKKTGRKVELLSPLPPPPEEKKEEEKKEEPEPPKPEEKKEVNNLYQSPQCSSLYANLRFSSDLRLTQVMLHLEATCDLRRAEGAHALRGLRAGNKEEDPQDERCVIGHNAIACPFHFASCVNFSTKTSTYRLSLFIFTSCSYS
jgi:hypothetical protein